MAKAGRKVFSLITRQGRKKKSSSARTQGHRVAKKTECENAALGGAKKQRGEKKMALRPIRQEGETEKKSCVGPTAKGAKGTNDRLRKDSKKRAEKIDPTNTHSKEGKGYREEEFTGASGAICRNRSFGGGKDLKKK